MVEKLLGNALRMNTTRHEVMAPIAQYAHEFSRQGVVQKLENGFAVRRIARGHGAVINVLPGALAQGRDVGNCGRFRHDRVHRRPSTSRTITMTSTTPRAPLGP